MIAMEEHHYRKKYKKERSVSPLKPSRFTGEDIDMLHESQMDGDDSSAGSDAYKDDIDGA